MPSQTTSLASLIHRCTEIYPEIVAEVYKDRVKDPKKLQTALENDKWRFDEFPAKARKAGKISKSELERLVQWKITHGVNRPFLPSMIRKNDSGNVSDQTSTAFKIISKLLQSTTSPAASSAGQDKTTSQALETTRKALDAACTLTGVGPATGTLILSVFDPDGTPFFQDELYKWLCSAEKKLKYDVKEYVDLWKKVRVLLLKVNGGDDGSAASSEGQKRMVRAVDVEKTAYVLEHLDVLEEEKKTKLFSKEDIDALKAINRSDVMEGNGHEESEEEMKPTKQSSTGKKSSTKSSAKEPTKRAVAEAETSEEVKENETRKSKRKKT